MTANFRSETPTSSNFSRPSVPLSVYRELVQELQATQARIEALEAQNQTIVKQNQQLRQEIEQVLRYAQNLQEVIAEREARIAAYSAREVKGTQAPPPKPKPPASVRDQKQVIEVESDRDRYLSPSKSDGRINGWVLAIALMLIVVTSSLGAFLIVSSRLSNSK